MAYKESCINVLDIFLNLVGINLDSYEISFIELLHDISSHTQNLYAKETFQIEKE